MLEDRSVTMMLEFDCRHQYPGGFRLDASFELTGRIGALFGPSGSGKTTIVSLIAGILRPKEGVIRLDDERWADAKRKTWIKPEDRRVGVVFQDSRLFPHKTTRSNLEYGLRRSKNHAAIPFDRVVEILELDDLLDRRPDTLSGGQQRRVAIGRALLRGPRLLLLDEPLTGLDEALSAKIIRYIDRTSRILQAPMIIVTHNQALVRRFADEVVVLESGRVIASGAAAETLDRATLKTMASHPGPTNVLRIANVRLVGDHAVGTIGNQSIYLPRSAWTGSEEAFVEIDPTDIIIATGEARDLSTRNRLDGTITDRVHRPDRECWYVAIDVGQTLWAEVTGETIRELHLEEGARVGCLIKAMAMKAV